MSSSSSSDPSVMNLRKSCCTSSSIKRKRRMVATYYNFSILCWIATTFMTSSTTTIITTDAFTTISSSPSRSAAVSTLPSKQLVTSTSTSALTLFVHHLSNNVHDSSKNNSSSSNSSTSSSSSSSSSSSYTNKERQKSLFQSVAKYNQIQNQLSLLNNKNNNNLPSMSTITTSTTTTTKTRRIGQQSLLTSYNDILDQQAHALQISKSTLSYIQLKGQKAREEILLSNMGLVHSTVKKALHKVKRNAGIGTATTASTSTKNTNNPILSTKNGINKEDLIQEGMIGLTYAIDKFDLSRNVNFSTYAMYWIEGRIMRYIKMKSNFVHIPEYMQDIIYKVERKVYDMEILFWENGYYANVDTTTTATTTNDNNNNNNNNSGKSSNVHSGMDDNDHFTKMENVILQDESKMRFLCNELGYDRQTIMNAFKVRRTMYNTKSNSIVELEDWMSRATRTTTSAIVTADTTPDIAAMNTLANDEDRNSDSQVVLERYQNILGQFISMKEMEALSWRYGLLNKEEEQEKTIQSSSSSLSVNGRDYEAEAEYDLFGPGGILNMNNAKETTVSTIAPIVQTPQPVSINTQSKAKITIRSGGTSPTISQPSTKASFTLSNKGGRWGEAMSFNEVGEQMRVSAEYGRRLCASALKKLTKAVDEGRLDPAMLF